MVVMVVVLLLIAVMTAHGEWRVVDVDSEGGVLYAVYATRYMLYLRLSSSLS